MSRGLAVAVCDYIEGLTITAGPLAGQRFKLFPWERRFIRGALASGINSAALSIGRGNGKSALVAGIACAAIDPHGPLTGQRVQTVCVASSLQQAGIVFSDASAMLRETYDLSSKELWRSRDSQQHKGLEFRPSGAELRCIGSDPGRAHGLRPTLVLADEPAQWPRGRSPQMYAALLTSMGKVAGGGRFIALGTRPESAGHWFARLLSGGADYAQTHAAAKDDPPYQHRTWIKANPSLSRMPDLEAVIRSEAAKAKQDANLVQPFRALRLNLGESDTRVSHVLEAATWERIEALPGERVGAQVWGVDLGQTAAMSAIAAYWPRSGRLEALAAFPAQPGLRERGDRDAVGDLYQQMSNRGELIEAGARAVAVPVLVEAALERWGRPHALATDRWREAELRDALEAVGVPPAQLQSRGQGFKDGSFDLRAFRRAALEDRVRPQRSLLLRSAVAAARTVSDAAGNVKLARSEESDQRRQSDRDDALAAAILAVSLGERRRSELKPRRRLRAVA